MKQFNNKYFKVPLLFSGGGGDVPEWRRHLQPCEYIYPAHDTEFINITNIIGNNTLFVYFRINSNHKDNSIINGRNITLNYFDTTLIASKINNITIGGGISAASGSVLDFNSYGLSRYGKYVNNNFTEWSDRGTINNGTIKIFDGCRTYFQRFEITNTINLLSCYVIDEYTDNKGNLCSSGVPGMVDITSGIFYTNDGTGQFSHGGDIEIEF